MKRCVLLVVLVAGVFFWTTAQAEVSQKEKLIHADKNKDGVVDKKEMKMEKNWEAARTDWKINKSVVNTSLEHKYDKNNDGYLDAGETSEMLKDRCAIIKTDGKARVDSPIEAAYDLNKDGVIDQNEVSDLRNDLKDEWRMDQR